MKKFNTLKEAKENLVGKNINTWETGVIDFCTPNQKAKWNKYLKEETSEWSIEEFGLKERHPFYSFETYNDVESIFRYKYDLGSGTYFVDKIFTKYK